MSNRLAQLTDTYTESETIDGLPVEPVYLPNVNTDDIKLSTGEGVPTRITVRPKVSEPEPALSDFNTSVGTKLDNILNKLTGAKGQERYQLWPEKVVREGLSAAGDVMKEGTVNPGLRREDYTDILKPDMPTNDSTWLGKLLKLAPVASGPQDNIIEKAQAVAALTGTGGLAGGVEGAALNATPSLRPALRYKDKLYKGREGQQHQDIIPKELYPEFERMAMSGEDISHYNFGFVNDKGQFLNREKALEYGINTGLIDPHAGKYGALTSTLMADSSKPGVAIEAVAKTASPFFSALEHNVSQVSQSKMTGDQWLGTLNNKPGVKPEELQWTGLGEFLKENTGKPVTKEQIQEHLANNKVELKEVSKVDKIAIDPVVKFIHESLGPASKHITDAASIADARKFNAHFRETTKGMSDEEVLNAARVSEKLEGVGDSKYHSYQLPGGENYREMLLTLPVPKASEFHTNKVSIKSIDGTPNKELYYGDKLLGEFKDYASEPRTIQEWQEVASRRFYGDASLNIKPAAEAAYKSSHWDEPNILAHVRMNDRVIDGKKSLHMEEIQSDWHQQGRDKGYKGEPTNYKVSYLDNDGYRSYDNFKSKAEADVHLKVLKEKGKEEPKIEAQYDPVSDKGVPDAPFKKLWHELALKRMIREAAEKGYDRLSWTPGEAQAARYDLSKTLDQLHYNKTNGILTGYKNGESVLVHDNVKPENLPDFVGKEAAKKLLEAKEPPSKIRGAEDMETFRLKDVDLKIGGEGMKSFYDQIIPKSIEKLGKEHGVKVKSDFIKNKDQEWPFSIKISHDGDKYWLSGKSPKVDHANEVTLSKKFNSYEEADSLRKKFYKGETEPVYYIDIPQSLKDQAMHKGFPLFSKGFMFVPVNHDPFEEKK